MQGEQPTIYQVTAVKIALVRKPRRSNRSIERETGVRRERIARIRKAMKADLAAVKREQAGIALGEWVSCVVCGGMELIENRHDRTEGERGICGECFGLEASEWDPRWPSFDATKIRKDEPREQDTTLGKGLVCVLCGKLFDQKEGQYVSKAQRAAERGLCESCYEVGPADLKRPFPRAVRTEPLPEAGR